MTTVLGAVQNKVKKTGPEEASECGVPHSKTTPLAVQDIVAVHKMARCWEDAAEGNRQDRSSTKGYVFGSSTPEILRRKQAF